MDGSILYLLYPSATTFAVALLLVPLVRAFARRHGVLAYPDRVRRFHSGAMPLWGGVGVYLAMAAGLLVSLWLERFEPALANLAAVLLPAAGLACFFGALDDRWNFNARKKLALQLLSVLPVVAAGYHVDGIALFGYRVDLGWFGIPLTVFWLLGCINALNLIDGMDGLASMVGLSAAVMIGVIAASVGNGHVATVAMILAGALAGFLFFNLPPASIFLGDSGSTMIGLVIGILGIQGNMKASATLAITAPAVVMTLPLFDVAMAVIRRKLSGRPLEIGDRAHIHHRLLDRGLQPWQVLCIINALCLATGAAAMAAAIFRMDVLAWAGATCVVVLMVRFRLFGDHELGLLRGFLKRQVFRLVGSRDDLPPVALEPNDAGLGDDGPVPQEEPRRRAA